MKKYSLDTIRKILLYLSISIILISVFILIITNNKILELFINTREKTRNRVCHVLKDVKSYLTDRKTSWIDRAKEWLSIGKYNYVSV